MNCSNEFNPTKSADLSREFRKEGNQLFTKKHDDDDSHIQVLSLYTKSIAFAPRNSEELALGYGNRSAFLHHVQKYEECINDIDKALLISESDGLKAKLLSRKATCLKFIAKSNNSKKTEVVNSKKLDPPKMITSKKVSCVAESLSLKYNEKYGKHFVANQDIKPGEILAAEKAYISFPLISKIYLVCSHCLTQTWNGLPCDFCAESVYCSEHCKKNAWQEYHDIECLIFTNINPLSLVPNRLDQQAYRAGLRLFIKTIKNYSFDNIIEEIMNTDKKFVNGIFSCHQFQSIYNLATYMKFEDTVKTRNFVEIVIKFLFQNTSIFTCKEKSVFESDDKLFSFVEELFIRLISIIDINGYMFEDILNNCSQCLDHINETTDCGTKGTIFVPCCSLFNHECVPNVEWFFGKNNKIFFFSVRHISKGEQIFTNYREPLGDTPAKERQLLLKEKFNFFCKCQACSENWLLPLETDPIKEEDKMQEIFVEHENFCRSKGFKNIIADHPEFWDCSEKTLLQMLNMIELIYKNLKGYDAFAVAEIYKNYLHKTFCTLYGLEWERMKKCR